MGDDDDAREAAALHGRRRRGEGDDRWDGGGGWWVSGSTEGPAAGTVSGGSSAATSSLFSSTSSLTDEEEDGDGGATSASSPPDRVLPGVVGVGNGADGRGRRRDGRRAALRAVHDARGSPGSHVQTHTRYLVIMSKFSPYLQLMIQLCAPIKQMYPSNLL